MKEIARKNECVKLEAQLDRHLKIQKAHWKYETDIRGLAQVNKSIHSIYLDHMAKVHG